MLIESLVYGTIDMAFVGTAALTQFEPKMGIFDLPFLCVTMKFRKRLD